MRRPVSRLVSGHRLVTSSFFGATVVLLMASGGCPSSGLVESTSVRSMPMAERRPDDSSEMSELISRIDRVLADNLNSRQLDVATHGAWQVLHGILAYGEGFEVRTPSGTKLAIEYLLQGNTLEGFRPQPGDLLSPGNESGDPISRGLRFAFEPSTKTGQGHRDQWMAVLAQSGITLETNIRVGNEEYQWRDVVRQTEYDIPLNLEEEFSWTLIGLLAYRETDHRWVARDEREYSIELLLEVELSQSIESSVCGGTHRLDAIAVAVAKRQSENKPMTGVWARAGEQLQRSIADAKQNQNPDGSYSLAYMHRPGWARDLSEQLGTTGHVLEFIALAGDDSALRSSWVKRSAHRICDLLEQCREVDLECGVLYHAIHGLQEYRSRVKNSL